MSFNHARAFERMKLIGDIKDSKDPSLFAMVCQTNVTDLPQDVFNMIKEQIDLGHEAVVVSMFGESIVKRVKLYV